MTRRRHGTETVEFTISFAAFLAMFSLLIIVIIVFVNAIAAQRALNEYAVAVGSIGGTTGEIDTACRDSFKPISQGSNPVACGISTATNLQIGPGVRCVANARIKVRLTYYQQYLPPSLANLVGAPSETQLTRSMIVLSQSSRGKAPCT